MIDTHHRLCNTSGVGGAQDALPSTEGALPMFETIVIIVLAVATIGLIWVDWRNWPRE